MNTIKNLSLIILSFILFTACAEAQTKRKTTNKKTPAKTTKPAVKPANNKPAQTTPAEYKVLVEGQFSKVDVPFLVVARDAETYALIRTLVDKLPASSTIDFTKTAVVAAFAGERNKGGWTVAIRQIPGKTVVDLREPPKGEMTAQVISQPFQVVQVPLLQNQSLSIEATPTWTNRLKMYRISKADFESSGGIDGRVRKFSVAGSIGVLSFGDIVTYHFDFSGAGNEPVLKLFASGVVKTENVQMTWVEPRIFGDMPLPPLKIFGTANDNKLSLTFESHPPIIADGFMLRGTLEAVRNK